MTLGLISYLDAIIVVVPSFMKADRLAKEMIASGHAGPPPPEFTKALRRGGLGATSVLVLLLTLIFVVAAGLSYF